MTAAAFAGRRPLAALLAALSLGALAAGSVAAGFAGAGLRASAVVGALGCAALLLGRAPRRSDPVALAILETRALGREAGVALLSCAGRRWLVGWGARGVTLLSELPPGLEDRP
ncbi:MAG TPA: flagellar biosynthetic protein FliO [Anaeromyxobacteraceae bacterium]|nr:flagellar biosynthetic protein FliO [Anaeromyxobacteraceae bacterium]